MSLKTSLLSVAIASLLIGCGGNEAATEPLAWPEIQPQTRPWTRWWQQGSAVTDAGLTQAMEAYAAVGLGGLEITPIYGVAGHEREFIQYLSPEWMARLDHTLAEAKRLGLGIDMANGSGWPFGGPNITPEYGAKYVAHRVYSLAEGQRLTEPIQFRQAPVVRAVGTQVYELHGFLGAAGERTQGSMENPLRKRGVGEITIDQLVEPLSANEDLQALALDQVRFPKQLPMQTLIAYSSSGEHIDLTDRVDAAGMLDWTAPAGSWKLYAVFQGWHGKNVERAAPGGEGYVIDHFSEEALHHYLERFEQAFEGHDLSGIRAFFNDSYEVDDARGDADWTPALFDEFSARRGYDLRAHLPALFGDADEDENRRVLSDFRETISDLLRDRFTVPWREWAHGRGKIIRNQSHGSPANILDLYAASDIPETEGIELLRIKTASSAAHVTGRPLASAEAATWLDEHFLSSLSAVKASVDRYFVGGVNHIFYHGTAYSPQDEAWPGWLFYAAVHFQPVNPFWKDFAALNEYIARTQSFLQQGKPNNDVLLYYPIYDRFATPGPALIEHFDGGIGPFAGTAMAAAAETLIAQGYSFDFISDRQLQDVALADGGLTAGGARYRALVVPASRYIPLATFEKVAGLAAAGAKVIAYRGLPDDVPGLDELEQRRQAFHERVEASREALLIGDDLPALLTGAGVNRETMVDGDLQYIRRAYADGYGYFIVNSSNGDYDGAVRLSVPAASVARFDPMTGKRGLLDIANSDQVPLHLDPGEGTILRTFDHEVSGERYDIFTPSGAQQPIEGTWTVTFKSGGPELPEPVETQTLGSWTDLDGDAVKAFSGTATYAISFPRSAGQAQGWILDLGAVRESAAVRLNGQAVGTLIGPSYRLYLDASALADNNRLEIDVSNLMANRIADMDRRQLPWKKFYNANFPSRLAANRGANGLFDASKWTPLPSGLLGPVTLTPADVR